MKKSTLLSFMLFIVAFSFSQHIPQIKVKDKPLGLSSLDIKVEVVGNIATTTYDMLFHNPTNSILEGQLDFPLGDGHNVSRFALDVNGKLREAVVVEKELGRIAFEDVVRGQVDPALLEKGTGNNYKARIYPIPANGYKRVLLAYEQEILLKDDAHYYNLPLNFKNKLDDFKLEITVFEQQSKPVIEKGQLSNLEFSNWERNYRTKISKQDFTPNKSILLKIPMPSNAKKILVFDNYFYAYTALSAKKRLRSKPEKTTIYWDASLSMENRNIEKEINLLESYFSKVKNIEVSFISFSNVILNNKTFTIQNGNWDTLKKEISNTVYDGATNYDLLNSIHNTSDINFLFSDGLATLSNYNFITSKPFFVVNSLVKSNYAQLNQLVEKSNGSYINLNTLSISEAIDLTNYEPLKFISCSTNSKTLEIYPKDPVMVKNDFSFTGKNYKNGDIITLNFGYGNTITQSFDIEINHSKSSNTVVKRIWAQHKLNSLAINTLANKTEITKLGIDYNIVTDYTSLIVLEDIRDYVRYKITPPEELLEEYNQLLAEIEERKKKESTISNAVSLRRYEEAPDRMVSDDERTQRHSTLNGFLNVAPGLDINDEVFEFRVAESSDGTIDEAARLIRTPDSTMSSSSNLIGNTQSPHTYKGELKIKDRTLNSDYIKALRKTKSLDQAYKLYLTQRKEFLKKPEYFSDVSTYFKERFKEHTFSTRILSNISEADFDNYELLKIYAYQLQLIGKSDLAVFIFQRILELRPEDSQSYRDLALAYQKIGKCQEALELLNDIITGEIYNNTKRRKFKGITLVATNEIKHLIQNYKDDLDLSNIDKALLTEIEFDIRVVVDWNHNDTDIDLHVIDPNLEECYYSHPLTKIGGQMSPDMTQGFGPEEFVLNKAKKGDYYIKIKYYGDRYQKVENPTFMKVTIYKSYGTLAESKHTQMIRLTNKDDQEIIAKVSI